MDGRSHPADLEPSYYGHSIGWWEGDTLVIDSTGFNESFWLDRRGMPHTTQLHTIERFTRKDSETITYEITVDDPGAYTADWTGGFDLGFERGVELFEYSCQQANYAVRAHGRRRALEHRSHEPDRSVTAPLAPLLSHRRGRRSAVGAPSGAC